MCDFLPASVHEALEGVESSLCLPVLVLIVLCTVQFMVHHVVHAISVLKELCRTCPPKRRSKCSPPSLADRIKGFICELFKKKKVCPKPKPVCKSKAKPKPKPKCCTTDGAADDDWDDDDDDENEEDIFAI